ncbi:MAG: hypothetical protein K2K03_10740 [Prevotella sp.]|nr:hypothetical protein [Prevotella sp.]
MKLPQSNLVVRNIAEVGAAGRYIAVPSGVPKANHAFTHAFTGVFLYTNGVGVTLFVHY